MRAVTASSTLPNCSSAIFLSFGKNLKPFTSNPASLKASSMSSSLTVDLGNENQNNNILNNKQSKNKFVINAYGMLERCNVELGG